MGKSPLERFSVVRVEGDSNALAEGWRRHGLKWQHGLLPSADVLAAFDNSYRHVWFSVASVLAPSHTSDLPKMRGIFGPIGLEGHCFCALFARRGYTWGFLV